MAVLLAPFSGFLLADGYASGPDWAAYPELWNGLVGAWVPALMDQGVRLYDSSQFANDGTFFGSPVWTVHEDWLSLDLDGVDDFVNIGNPKVLQITGEMSLVARFLLDDISATAHRIISKLGSSGNRGWELLLDDDPRNNLMFRVASASDALFDVKEPTEFAHAGKWSHAVGVFVPSVGSFLYFNGSLIASNTTSPPSSQFNSTANVNIGRSPIGGAYWDGKIADVRVYARALTPEEIALDYAVPFAPFRVRPRFVWVAGGGQTFTHSSDGTLAPAGAVARQAQDLRGGSLAVNGTLGNVGLTAYAGTLASAGALLRRVHRADAGTVAPAATVVRSTAVGRAGAASSAGSVQKGVRLTPVGSIVPAGMLTYARHAVLAVSGVLSAAGEVIRGTHGHLAGGVSAAAAVTARVAVAVSASLSVSGHLVRSVLTRLAGAVSAFGAVIAEAVGRMFAPKVRVATTVTEMVRVATTVTEKLSYVVTIGDEEEV